MKKKQMEREMAATRRETERENERQAYQEQKDYERTQMTVQGQADASDVQQLISDVARMSGFSSVALETLIPLTQHLPPPPQQMEDLPFLPETSSSSASFLAPPHAAQTQAQTSMRS